MHGRHINMRSTIVLSLLATAGFSAAQEQYSIDPNSVSKSTRSYWCQMAQTQCPLICLQQPGVTSQNTIKNDCSPDNLSYSCVCDNNVAPNVTEYTQTMPFFICQEWGNQCRKKCNGDNTCADKCTADHPCGATDPYKGNASTPASTSSSPSATQLRQYPGAQCCFRFVNDRSHRRHGYYRCQHLCRSHPLVINRRQSHSPTSFH
ncbi:hypothetical protein DM02DRAFT_152682 [Periconia macrospinosa]|uniref:DUF7707 domain-containing protein n=1 Tax=Periconia macrospinosa TaxID=97972 RepID=A0A2V1EBU6_9PLEO|nr:hypothetical protein DM02DRAFT_152682 [Periconia macrospinosa]